MDFVLVNGVPSSKKDANPGRFLWNSSVVISQDIWFGFGGIPLLNENLDNIQSQLQSLSYELPPLFNNRREIFRLFKRLLNKNKYYRSGYLHLKILVSDQESNWLLETTNYEGFEFPNREQGLLTQISPFQKFSGAPFGRLLCHNRLFWLAAETKNEAGSLSRSIFTNEKGQVCDARGANIFLAKNGVLHTPSLDTGCYGDLIRRIVIEQAAALKIPLIESNEIDEKKLLAADEIFLASEARGIEWIMGIGTKRFVRNYSLIIHENVNAHLQVRAQKQLL